MLIFILRLYRLTYKSDFYYIKAILLTIQQRVEQKQPIIDKTRLNIKRFMCYSKLSNKDGGSYEK